MIRGARHCKQSLKGALHFNLNPPFSLSIHCPSTCLLKLGHSGSKLKFPVPPEGVVPRPDKIWVYPYLVSVTHALKTSKGVILTRASNHFIQLLSTSSSNGSPLRSLWMSELLTLPLKLAPATPRKKLISATCIHNFSLLLIIWNSWP